MMLWLYIYLAGLPISALVMFVYPLLRRKTLPLSQALRHSTIISVMLLAASHLMLFFTYVYVYEKNMLWDKVLPVPLVFLAVALMFAISCLILVAIFGCSRAVLRKLIPQE